MLFHILDPVFGIYNYPFLTPLFVPALVTLVGVAPAGAVSLLWAPFGALVCAVLARRRGLSPRRYAFAGAAHSAFFFLPWVYLVARMLGWVIPKPLIAIPYAVLYAAWLQGPFQLSYDSWTGFDDLYPNALWLCVWLGNILTMMVSMLLMMSIAKRINPFRHESRAVVPVRDTLPNPVYLMPFALLWGWTAVLMALLTLVWRLVD